MSFYVTQSTNTTDIVEDSLATSPNVKIERNASIALNDLRVDDDDYDEDEPPGSGDGPELASSSDDRVGTLKKKKTIY